MDPSLLALGAAVFGLAALTRATFGFGDALVAVPLLTLFLPPQVALPAGSVISVLLAIGVGWKNRERIEWKSVARLLAAMAAGVPAGVWLLSVMNTGPLQILLGFTLLGFAAASFAPRLPRLHHPAWQLTFGLASGVLSGSLTTGGPPLVIYGTLRGWSPRETSANLQALFLPIGVVVSVGHGLAGMWTPDMGALVLASLVPVVVLAWVGLRLNGRFPVAAFRRALIALLAVLGVLMLVRGTGG